MINVHGRGSKWLSLLNGQIVSNPRTGGRIFLSFLPRWYHKNYGFEFGKRYLFDPEYRVRLDMEAQRLMHERFGDIGLGCKDPEPTPHLPFSVITIPVLLGGRFKVADDQFPWVTPAYLTDDEIRTLSSPEVEEVYPVNEWLRQVSFLQHKYGGEDFMVDCQGVLNVALKLRGEQILLDLVDNSYLAHKLLQVITETILKTINCFRRVSRHKDLPVIVGNCSVVMVSPKMYTQSLFRYDSFLLQNFPHPGIHHCGVIDSYLGEYSRHIRPEFIQAGWGSNWAKLRTVFPTQELLCFIGPKFYQSATPWEMAAAIQNIRNQAGPDHLLTVSLPDIDYSVADEVIRAAVAPILMA